MEPEPGTAGTRRRFARLGGTEPASECRRGLELLSPPGATRLSVHYSNAILDGVGLPRTSDDHTPLSTAEEEFLVEATGKIRAQAGDAIGLVFSPRPLADNWFSHWHERSSVAVVSTAGLDWVNQNNQEFDLRSFVLYEILLHGLRGYGWRPEEHFHQDSRGCLFDFCGMRSDIEMKLQVGDFCSECRRALERAGLYPSPAGEIAHGIQSLAWVCDPSVRTARARGGPSMAGNLTPSVPCGESE